MLANVYADALWARHAKRLPVELKERMRIFLWLIHIRHVRGFFRKIKVNYRRTDFLQFGAVNFLGDALTI